MIDLNTTQHRTPFEAGCAALGWSLGFAAEHLGIPYSRAREWTYGKNSRGNASPAPDAVVEYLGRVLLAVRALTKPDCLHISVGSGGGGVDKKRRQPPMRTSGKFREETSKNAARGTVGLRGQPYQAD